MLPRIYRLPLRGQWPIIKKEGRVYHSRLFTLIVAGVPSENSEGIRTRWGFVVSGKISKKAVVRNQVKRLLREGARSFLARAKPNFSVLILAKPAILGKDLEEIKEEMEKLFQKAGLL